MDGAVSMQPMIVLAFVSVIHIQIHPNRFIKILFRLLSRQSIDDSKLLDYHNVIFTFEVSGWTGLFSTITIQSHELLLISEQEWIIYFFF